MTDIFSARIRWVAIATGVASALALFPALFLLPPALLIAGGLMQPRFPTTGKWFLWVGAANLWVLVIVYDGMMIQDSRGHTETPEYMLLTFLATTVLLIWCSVELVSDAIKRMSARRSMLPVDPRPIGRGLWVLAVVLNLALCRLAVGWILAPGWYGGPGGFYLLAMLLVQVTTLMAFDVWLMKRVLTSR
jgi:hypothetical protein